MSIQLAKANRILVRVSNSPWPDSFTTRELAILQAWNDEYIPGQPGLLAPMWDVMTSLKASPFIKRRSTGRVWETMPSEMTLKEFTGEIVLDREGNLSSSHSSRDGGTVLGPAQTIFQQEQIIDRDGLLAWLQAEGLEASPMVRAWLESAEIVAAPRQTPDTPAIAPAGSEGLTSRGSAGRKTRRNHLDHVIEAAQKTCDDPYDAAAVWAVLASMAKEKIPPFLGVAEEGIQWEDAKDSVQFLSLKSLRDRLRRQRGKAQ